MPTLNWIGKEAVEQHHKEVPFRLLEPVEELSCGETDSSNLIVQGDNLHALKALLPRYAGKVKCIYIDPPYNTGNEGWIYNDNVNSPEIRRWLGEVVGKEGETLDRHDRWLCMIYPRLKMLKSFLREDGVIFISLDDNEIGAARIILDEIFNRNNFVATFAWHSEGHSDNQFPIKINHEYIICYAKNAQKATFGYVIDPNTIHSSNLWSGFAENSITKNGPKNPPSSIILPIGFPANIDSINLDKTDIPNGLIEAMQVEKLSSNPLKRRFGKVQFPLRMDSMVVRNGALTKPCKVFSGWANANKLREFIENDCKPITDKDGDKVHFYLSKNGVIYYRKERGERARNITSVLRNLSTTEKMRSELERMGIGFSYPKPKELIKYLIKIGSEDGDIVLDSFAGSGTTGHACLEMSAEGNDRKFILIEMNKETAESIIAKRLKKTINGYKDLNGVSVPATSGGFKYFKLSDEPLFEFDGSIRSDVSFDQLAEFVWFMETGIGLNKSYLNDNNKYSTPFLGQYKDRAVFLLYNGILKDKTDIGGNVLNSRTLELLDNILPDFQGQKIVYGARSRFDKTKLAKIGVTFHQLPYELAVKTWF